MSDDKRYVRIQSAEDAEAHGVDSQHLFDHMVEAVLCVSGGNEAVLDLGFYAQFTDQRGGVWTLSLIPADGGVISDALVHELYGEDT